MTEPGCGSDVNGILTNAVKKGNEVHHACSCCTFLRIGHFPLMSSGHANLLTLANILPKCYKSAAEMIFLIWL